MEMENLHHISDAMVVSQKHWAALANYLLLYDQIVIPTGNLQVIPVLRMMLGEVVFDELIRSKTIVLSRYDQWFSYVGGGSGLVFFKISPGNRADKGLNLGMANFMPLDQTVDLILDLTNPPSTTKRKSELSRLLLDNVVEIDLSAANEKLTQETYKDIKSSPYLRNIFSLQKLDLNRIGELPGTQMRVFLPHHLGSPETKEIDSVLRVAFENFILHLGCATEATDIAGDSATLTLLKAKGQRFGAPLEGRQAFAQIQEISGVPDLGEAFARKVLSPAEVLALRDSKQGTEFRAWFSAGAPSENAQEIVARFIERVGTPGWIDRLPAKVLRFGVTSGIGAVEPLTGALASFADSFLLSKWFPGKSPNLFLKQAKVLMSKKVNVVTEPSGRDRNKPCYCGSGEKYKHCHGRV